MRRPLRAFPDSLQTSRGVPGLDRDLPSSSKYSDLVGSRTAAVSAEISGPGALERNVTSSTVSHYAAGSDGPDSARGTSSGLSSGSTMLRPSSASAVLMSDKAGAPSALSSLVAANTAYASSAAAADYLARRGGSSSAANTYSTTSGTNVYSTMNTMSIAMSNLPSSSAPEPSVAAPLSGAGSTTPTKRLSKQLETMDLRHDTDTAALRQTESRAAVAPVVPRGVGDGEDQLSLQSMHSNISAVLVHVPPSSSSATKKVPVFVSLAMNLFTHACMCTHTLTHTHTHTHRSPRRRTCLCPLCGCRGGWTTQKSTGLGTSFRMAAVESSSMMPRR